MGHILAALIFTSLPSYNIDVKVTKKKVTKVVKHKVYITIDDHPTPHTDAFLAVLKKCKLRATFFVMGMYFQYYSINPKWGPNKRQYARYFAIQKAGHVIGNHSMTHRNLCKIKKHQVRWELGKTQKYLIKVLGIKTRYWRAPGFARCRMTWRVSRLLRLKHVTAHVDDYKRTSKWMWRKLRLRVRRGEKETILLFHNNIKKFRAFLRMSSLCSSP